MTLAIPLGAAREAGEISRRVECSLAGLPRAAVGVVQGLIDAGNTVRLRAAVLGVQPAPVVFEALDGVLTVTLAGRRRRVRPRSRSLCPRATPSARRRR